jgi:hypothetical protein
MISFTKTIAIQFDKKSAEWTASPSTQQISKRLFLSCTEIYTIAEL